MGIEAVTSPNTTPPSAFSHWKEKLSQVDWKTHSLVVLSYLLLSFGIALACSSVYIAFIAHPMVAMAAPTPFIALGALGLWLLNRPRQAQDATAPPGIKNIGQNCWVNSALQVLFNAYKKTLEIELKKSQSFWQKPYKMLMPNSGILPLLKAFENYKKGIPVDSQQIRAWMHGCNPENISIDPHIPDDPKTLIAYFLEHTHSNSIVSIQSTRKKNAEASIQTQEELAHTLHLCPYHFASGNNSLQDALNCYFNSSEEVEDKRIHTFKFFKTTPQNFSVEVSANVQGDQKSARSLENALHITLGADQAGEKTDYTSDAFICHRGSSVAGGHYVAYLLIDGSWWEVSDSTVKKITNPQSYLASASYIHYAAKAC